MSTEFKAWLVPSDDTYHGLAAHEPGLVLAPHTYKAKKFEDYDIEVKITHCGICGSDIHTASGGWGEQKYPLVVGHEIVGYITRVGSAVNPEKYYVGRRVGIGAQCRSCLTCRDCKNQKEHVCANKIDTYTGVYEDGYVAQGGYADYVRVHHEWAIPIPDGLASDIAAPMMCAGITTYQPLKKFGAGPGKRVGVIGVGGLGHLGIQWAVAMGAHVTAISTSERKRVDAKEVLGAHDFLNTSDPAQLKAASRAFDIVLCTAFGSNTDWSALLELVDSDGTFILVGLPEKPLSISPFVLVGSQVAIVGSHLGPNYMIEEMLNFAVTHGVKTIIETKPMSEAGAGLHQLETKGARYRIVLVQEGVPQP